KKSFEFGFRHRGFVAGYSARAAPAHWRAIDWNTRAPDSSGKIYRLRGGNLAAWGWHNISVIDLVLRRFVTINLAYLKELGGVLGNSCEPYCDSAHENPGRDRKDLI